MNHENSHQSRANRVAPIMFGLSVLFVMLLASLIVVWVDIPRVAELSVLSELENDTASDSLLIDDPDAIVTLVNGQSLVKLTNPIGKWVQLALFMLWPVFWLEYGLFAWLGERHTLFKQGGWFRLLACFIPPLRIAAPEASHDGRIWLPRWGWRHPGKILGRDLEQAFGKPMLAIALLILPILLIEYGLHSVVEQHAWLRLLLHMCTGFIWCAFTLEFLVMISATDKRLHYVKTHWIDLAIILLPLISFLRSFRVLRLTKLARVQKLAKMGRVFRVRGLLMKVMRAMMLLGFINRLLRVTPEKRLYKLKLRYADQMEDLESMREDIEELELEILTNEGLTDSVEES